jgi:hypothetical protein
MNALTLRGRRPGRQLKIRQKNDSQSFSKTNPNRIGG